MYFIVIVVKIVQNSMRSQLLTRYGKNHKAQSVLQQELSHLSFCTQKVNLHSNFISKIH